MNLGSIQELFPRLSVGEFCGASSSTDPRLFYRLNADKAMRSQIVLDGDHLSDHAVGLSRHSSRRPFSILLFI